MTHFMNNRDGFSAFTLTVHCAQESIRLYTWPKTFDDLPNELRFMILEYCIPEATLEPSCHTPGLLIRSIIPILSINKRIRYEMCVILQNGAKDIFPKSQVEMRSQRKRSLMERADNLNLDIICRLDTIQYTWLNNPRRTWYYKTNSDFKLNPPWQLKQKVDRDGFELITLKDIIRVGARGQIRHGEFYISGTGQQRNFENHEDSRSYYKALESELQNLDKRFTCIEAAFGSDPWALDQIVPSWVWQDQHFKRWIWDTNYGSWHFAVNYDEILDYSRPTPDGIQEAIIDTFSLVLGAGARINRVRYCFEGGDACPNNYGNPWDTFLPSECNCVGLDCVYCGQDENWHVWAADLDDLLAMKAR